MGITGSFLVTMNGMSIRIAHVPQCPPAFETVHPLRDGDKGSRLLKYFEFEDLKKIPDNRIHSAEKVDEGERKIATEISQMLGKITPEKIYDDLTQINAGKPFHRKF